MAKKIVERVLPTKEEERKINPHVLRLIKMADDAEQNFDNLEELPEGLNFEEWCEYVAQRSDRLRGKI